MQDFIDDKLELWKGHCFEYPLPNSFNKVEAHELSEIKKIKLFKAEFLNLWEMPIIRSRNVLNDYIKRY